MGIEFNEQQIYGLYDIENWWHHSTKQLYQLSGASGCGKTFLVRYAIERLGLDINEDVAFIAYMGKAALALAKNKLPARTAHSLIYDYKKVYVRDEHGHLQLDEKMRPKTTNKFVLKERLDKDYKLIVVDEGSMIPENMAKDILSFDIPVIVLGDLDQLPPVFGKPFFLQNPDYVLTKVMRQAENDPIVYLAHRALHGLSLQPGVYGKSFVIDKKDLNEYHLNNADIVLTATNKLRFEINNLFRTEIKRIRRLDMIQEGEKLICRKNNWDKSLGEYVYLVNGLGGFVDYVNPASYNKKSITIDFRPDFLKNKKFKNLKIDYNHLFASPYEEEDYDPYAFTREKFEFAYAITTHLSQGSQWEKALYLDEKGAFDAATHKQLAYTAITRASDSVGIVI